MVSCHKKLHHWVNIWSWIEPRKEQNTWHSFCFGITEPPSAPRWLIISSRFWGVVMSSVMTGFPVPDKPHQMVLGFRSPHLRTFFFWRLFRMHGSSFMMRENVCVCVKWWMRTCVCAHDREGIKKSVMQSVSDVKTALCTRGPICLPAWPTLKRIH